MTDTPTTPPSATTDAERENVRMRVWNALCSDDDPALNCPQCDGQIELIGEGWLVCDMCNKEWSADDVAERNRL